jgi:hypothetical protein
LKPSVGRPSVRFRRALVVLPTTTRSCNHRAVASASTASGVLREDRPPFSGPIWIGDRGCTMTDSPLRRIIQLVVRVDRQRGKQLRCDITRSWRGSQFKR